MNRPTSILAGVLGLAASAVAPSASAQTGTVKINGIAYQLGVEWLRYTPRFVARTVGGMFGKQLEDGF